MTRDGTYLYVVDDADKMIPTRSSACRLMAQPRLT